MIYGGPRPLTIQKLYEAIKILVVTHPDVEVRIGECPNGTSAEADTYTAEGVILGMDEEARKVLFLYGLQSNKVMSAE